MALNFDIRRDTHAIVEFAATMKFANPVSPNTFVKVVGCLDEAAKKLDLPAPINLQVFNLAIGAGNAPPPPVVVGGSGFQRFSANGEVACALLCEQDSITLTLREYDGWQHILPTIISTFSDLAVPYIAEVPAIRAFTVQYLNEFQSKEEGILDVSELFRKDSPWIAPFSFETRDLWHCHIGQFIPADGTFRYLVNINCDVLPVSNPIASPPKTHVRVLILAARNYDVPGASPLIAEQEKLAGLIEENFNDAHSLEKKLLNQTISDDYLAIMGDGARDH